MRAGWTMGFVAAAALSFLFPEFIVFRFTQAVVWSIALLGLVLLCGVGGQFSFAQAALFGLGGYSAALLATHTHLPIYAALLIAPVVGYGAGWALGRIAGGHGIWTQALITYAFAIAFPQLLRYRQIEQWTGGVGGLYLDAPESDRLRFLLALALLALGVWLARNVIASRSGRAVRAVRDDALAAAAQGIDVARTRAVTAGIAGAYLAVAGCLSAFQYGYVGPTTYTFAMSVQMLFGLVVGGMGSPLGAVLGGLVLQFLPDVVAPLGKGLSALLYAVLLIAAMVAMPEGIAGALLRNQRPRAGIADRESQ